MACTVTLSVIRRGPPNSGKSCIVLQSRPTCSLVAKFLSVQSSLAVCEFCAAEEERCEQGHGQVCANLRCRMSWSLKRIRTIAATYVSSADQLSIHYAKILPNRRLHGVPQITHKTVKIWGGGLEQVYGHLTGTMRYIQNGRRIVMR